MRMWVEKLMQRLTQIVTQCLDLLNQVLFLYDLLHFKRCRT